MPMASSPRPHNLGSHVPAWQAQGGCFADAAGLAALTALLGSVALWLEAGAVGAPFWWIAGGLAAGGSALLWRLPAAPRTPRGWLMSAAASVWLAVLFFGANRALDALNGPRASPIDTGGTLGGFELWYALCPGLTAMALAGWVRSLCGDSTKCKHCAAPAGLAREALRLTLDPRSGLR